MNQTNIVADLIKERNRLRGAVLLCKHEMTNRGLEWSAITREALDQALSSDAGKDYVKRQSQPEPHASTSGTAACVETAPAPCASDLPDCDNDCNKLVNLIDALGRVVCKSCGEPLSTGLVFRIVRIFHDTFESRRRASSATPPTGGMQGSGGASQP